MTESSYKDGEVVWVKWRSQWWPGEVWSSSRVPSEIVTSLRKPVIAFVKFFQEESFEFVRSPNNIMQYNCEKKLDFIKKGMDKYRTKSKSLENFPADVVTAEQLTNGDVNILKNLETPTKQKPVVAVATPERSTVEASPASASKRPASAYNSSSKVQFSASPAPKSDKIFTCNMCDFSTDRINLLMFHIKNHSSTFSPRVSDPSPVVRKVASKSPTKKASQPIDTIADDVRKIKESLKEVKPTSRKSRQAPPSTTTTPTGSRSRPKKAVELVKEIELKEEKPKPEPVNELKNELLADWSDDDEVVAEKEKIEERPKSPPPKPSPIKAGESSRSIRNIPKKQRVSEIYVKSDAVETPKSPIKESSSKVEELLEASESTRRSQKANNKLDESIESSPLPDVLKQRAAKTSKRKHTAVDTVSEPNVKKVTEDSDEDLIMATAELLNDTEVPKVENAQLPSTFHNDIDKRNLPPKERNKRIFRANQSRESPPETHDAAPKADSNGSIKETIVPAPKDELMLPHKKKQSSRLLTQDKPSPIRESRSPRDAQSSELRTRKKRKSLEISKSEETEKSFHESSDKQEAVQCPLRDEVTDELTSNNISNSRRGQKRRHSKDSHRIEDTETCSEPKKHYQSDSESHPKTVIACASETICISSKGELSVTCKDKIITTEASKVTVTSHVIITEAMHQPVVSSAPAHTPKSSAYVKSPSQSLKNALKIPAEELLEMKKQGLVTVGIDMKNKFTEKGKQIFKKIQEKTASEAAVEEKIVQEQTKSLELLAETVNSTEEVSEAIIQEDNSAPESIVIEPEAEPVKESNGTSKIDGSTDESTNNNDIEKEPLVDVPSPTKEIQDEPQENGSNAEAETEAIGEDTNSGAGLIALQAETFGGPPNCFYLCRQIEGRYEPVDNQILVLNAQNALVPYEGDISDSLGQTETAGENSTAYSQLSPNNNIIINTPNGQKIELDHMAILALQEQADENGIASIELSGEQLDLNINGILEAIKEQQEDNEGEALLANAMLIDGDSALIIDTSDTLPVEINHSATQVSETLTKPIMSSTIAPEVASTKAAEISETVSKNLNIEDSLATIGVTSNPARANVPKSLELPITITNPVIAETANHRKLANAPIIVEEVAIMDADIIVVQPTDNGSEN